MLYSFAAGLEMVSLSIKTTEEKQTGIGALMENGGFGRLFSLA
jgi:hypothetical protein